MAPAVKPKVDEMNDLAQKTQEGIATLTKNLDGLIDKLGKTPAANHPSPSQVFGTPWARKGEDPLTSRGFSFLKMLGVITGACPPEDAKIELDIASRLNTHYCKDLGTGGYDYRGGGHTGMNRFLAPLSTNFMEEKVVPQVFRQEMKSLTLAGVSNADPDEMKWITQKMLEMPGQGSKALSWLNELTGGALVAPPEMGELIALLRNKEALVNAGARVVPLPPQGRAKYPRQTGASTAYWLGENAPIPESTVGTGEVTLQAKKLSILIKTPNELVRFASPAAEALLRDDMTKSLALGLDMAGLEGAGGDHRPRGILNHPNINTITSSKTGANGDQVVGEDIYRMIAAIEESNAEMKGFIMRPKTLFKFYQVRADAVAQGDKSGPFLFNMIREANAGTPATMASYPVVTSTQVSQVRAKGTSTSLTYILAGMWEDVLIGMFGAIEFAANTAGDAFVNDQTWVRGILSADIQLRHEAAFALLDNLDTTL